MPKILAVKINWLLLPALLTCFVVLTHAGPAFAREGPRRMDPQEREMLRRDLQESRGEYRERRRSEDGYHRDHDVGAAERHHGLRRGLDTGDRASKRERRMSDDERDALRQMLRERHRRQQ